MDFNIIGEIEAIEFIAIGTSIRDIAPFSETSRRRLPFVPMV